VAVPKVKFDYVHASHLTSISFSSRRLNRLLFTGWLNCVVWGATCSQRRLRPNICAAAHFRDMPRVLCVHINAVSYFRRMHVSCIF